MKRYTVSEFCKMVGLPYSTLRYFERIGLLEPEKDTKNNYRQYAVKDAFLINRFKYARALGFDAKEAIQMLKTKEPTALIEQIKEKTRAYETELALLQNKVNFMNNYLHELETVETSPDYDFVYQEEKYFLPASEGNDFSISNDAVFSKWVDLLPMTCYSKRIAQEDFENNHDICNDFGMSIEANQRHYLAKGAFNDKIMTFKKGQYIRLKTSHGLYPLIDKDLFVTIRKILTSLHLKTTGDLYIEGSGIINNQGQTVQFVYIPID